MDSTDNATLIEELDERVERLRALYEQYFMGIERIEPLVLRKDVERRLWLLRREQIRNTALRFRLHSVVQRYNTYQQYWARICRDIENGTYQRDLNRAAERFGAAAALTAVGRRRQAMVEKGLAKRAEREARKNAQSSALPPPPSEAPPPLVPPSAPAAPAPPMQLIPVPAAGGSSTRKSAAPSAGSPPAPPRIARAAVPPPPPATPFSPLELDWDAGAPAPQSQPAAARPAVKPAAVQPAAAASPPPLPTAARAVPASPLPVPNAVPRPAAPPRAAASAGQQAKVRPASRQLSDDRVRELYGEYVEARRRCNEPTSGVSYEKVAATLRESARKLQAQHSGRAVDFEVVVKNGSAVLRPILRAGNR